MNHTMNQKSDMHRLGIHLRTSVLTFLDGIECCRIMTTCRQWHLVPRQSEQATRHLSRAWWGPHFRQECKRLGADETWNDYQQMCYRRQLEINMIQAKPTRTLELKATLTDSTCFGNTLVLCNHVIDMDKMHVREIGTHQEADIKISLPDIVVLQDETIVDDNTVTYKDHEGCTYVLDKQMNPLLIRNLGVVVGQLALDHDDDDGPQWAIYDMTDESPNRKKAKLRSFDAGFVYAVVDNLIYVTQGLSFDIEVYDARFLRRRVNFFSETLYFRDGQLGRVLDVGVTHSMVVVLMDDDGHDGGSDSDDDVDHVKYVTLLDRHKARDKAIAQFPCRPARYISELNAGLYTLKTEDDRRRYLVPGIGPRGYAVVTVPSTMFVFDRSFYHPNEYRMASRYWCLADTTYDKITIWDFAPAAPGASKPPRYHLRSAKRVKCS